MERTASGAYSYGVAASLPLGNGSCVSLLEYAEEAVLLQQLQQTFDNVGNVAVSVAGGGDPISYLELGNMSMETGGRPSKRSSGSMAAGSLADLLEAASN